jgi:hydroxyacylglutathione hydrolase
MIDIQMLSLGMFQSNCFIVSCGETREGVVIDAGDEGEVILKTIDRLHIDIKAILETHAHVDHVGALDEVKPALGVPVYMHKDELPMYGMISKQASMFGL